MKKLFKILSIILFITSIILIAVDTTNMELFFVSKMIGVTVLMVSGYMMYFLGVFDDE